MPATVLDNFFNPRAQLPVSPTRRARGNRMSVTPMIRTGVHSFVTVVVMMMLSDHRRTNGADGRHPLVVHNRRRNGPSVFSAIMMVMMTGPRAGAVIMSITDSYPDPQRN